MPRPRTVEDPELLDAVLALAHRVGPVRLTLAAAAKEVGLSPATLVQRFGTKRALLLAADRRGIERWTSSFARASADTELGRVVEGLVVATHGIETPEEMAGSVALLQLDLADPEFHAATLEGARTVRAQIAAGLAAARTGGELRPETDVNALAVLVETTYHGSVIGWAIHREGTLADWMRDQLRSVLSPWMP